MTRLRRLAECSAYDAGQVSHICARLEESALALLFFNTAFLPTFSVNSITKTVYTYAPFEHFVRYLSVIYGILLGISSIRMVSPIPLAGLFASLCFVAAQE